MTITVKFRHLSNKDNFKGKCLIHVKLTFLTLAHTITKADTLKGVFEGREGFCKSYHKLLIIPRDGVTCKHYSSLLSKITIFF